MNDRPHESKVCLDGKRRGCFRKLSPEERLQHFWAKVQRGNDQECWPWLGAKQPTRGLVYGVYGWEGKAQRTHRIAYMLAKGSIPDGLVVRHLCHNPLCCNPRHLETGTQAQNVEDAVRAGRIAAGERSGRRKHPEAFPVGEDCERSKLTKRKVLAIHRAYLTGKMHSGQLAIRHGITQTQLTRLLTFESWKHVRPIVESWGLAAKGLHRTNLARSRLLFGKRERVVRRRMRLLREKGLTLREIAKKFHCSESVVWNRINGE